MPKYSIIIPVYNVEKYIKKCLDSIFNQTYKNFEVIVVNDGTKDSSMDIVEKYDVKIINQKNQGLSAARNNGAKHAKGEYILFIDSDDYIQKDLLEEIDKSTKNNPDVIRFQIQEVYEDKDDIKEYREEYFENKNGVDAFEIISKYHFVENAWAYAFNRKYYQDNKYSFKVGTIHEDFGLIPLVIMKAKIVNSISYVGYSYLQRQGSIMSQKNYEKTKKKVNDFYDHYIYLENEINKTKLKSDIFKSFISNSLYIKICELEKDDYNNYKKLLKDNKVYKNILSNTPKRYIKKLLFRIDPKFALKFIK